MTNLAIKIRSRRTLSSATTDNPRTTRQTTIKEETIMNGKVSKTFQTMEDHIKEITTTITTKMVTKRRTTVKILITKTILNLIKETVETIKAIIKVTKEITSIIKATIKIIRTKKVVSQTIDMSTITETLIIITMNNLTTHTLSHNIQTSRNQMLP